MEFGSFMEFHVREHGSQADAFEESFAHIEQCEDLGLDAVWLAESHFNPSRAVLSSPMVIATAIASRTKTLKVGTAIQVLPLGNPIRMAEETATLDQISKGRFEFGVGRSGLPGAYEGYNIPYGESREKFFEFLEIIIKAWTNERFSYEGKFHSYHDVCLVPKPYQKPHPPIRIAATTSETFPAIGKMGFPIFIGVRSLTLGQVSEQVNSYIDARNAAGHDGPVDVAIRVPVYVADTDEQALEEAEESFMRQFLRLGGQLTRSATSAGVTAGEVRAARGEQLGQLTWDDVPGQKALVGSPESVVEQMHHMAETLHLSGLVGEFNAGELVPRDRVAKSLRLFCEKVVPEFK